jgi:hypothetical protein
MEAFPAGKLPSNRDILLRLCHVQDVGSGRVPISQLAYDVVDEAALVYNRARIKLMKRERARDKVMRLHGEWMALAKHKSRETQLEEDKRAFFKTALDRLCDFSKRP